MMAAGTALRVTVRMVTQFVRNGIVTEAQHGAFSKVLRDVARLQPDLALVPSHPHRAGGLSFLESYPSAYALVTLAVAAVVG